MFFTNKNFIFIQRSIGVWVVTANNEAFEPEYLYMRIEEERRETAWFWGKGEVQLRRRMKRSQTPTQVTRDILRTATMSFEIQMIDSYIIAYKDADLWIDIPLDT